MNQVKMIVSGKPALVPADKAKLIAKKEEYVRNALALRAAGDIHGASKLIGKIARLNPRIGPCVQFIR